MKKQLDGKVLASDLNHLMTVTANFKDCLNDVLTDLLHEMNLEYFSSDRFAKHESYRKKGLLEDFTELQYVLEQFLEFAEKYPEGEISINAVNADISVYKEAGIDS